MRNFETWTYIRYRLMKCYWQIEKLLDASESLRSGTN